MLFVTTLFSSSDAKLDMMERTVVKTIVSPYTGRVWMDRNLGASRVCTSFDDAQCFGDYFQWGRDSDGHEKMYSIITFETSSTNKTNHSKFIISNKKYHYDWRWKQNYNLWYRTGNLNNPCPNGFRVPILGELYEETLKQGVESMKDAFNSFLKLPAAGDRYFKDSIVYGKGKHGAVWSSTVIDNYSGMLFYSYMNANFEKHERANGLPVRCIKRLEFTYTPEPAVFRQ